MFKLHETRQGDTGETDGCAHGRQDTRTVSTRACGEHERYDAIHAQDGAQARPKQASQLSWEAGGLCASCRSGVCQPAMRLNRPAGALTAVTQSGNKKGRPEIVSVPRQV